MDPRWRGSCLGRLTTDRVERYARENGCAVLVPDAHTTNGWARAFYERSGFRIVGHHFVKDLRNRA